MAKRTIAPPFQLTPAGYDAWCALQREIDDPRSLNSHQRWRLAIAANHTAFYRRGRLEPELLTELQRIRCDFGLPGLPA